MTDATFAIAADGVADDTSALQAAFDAAALHCARYGAGVLFLPPGVLRVSRPIVINADCLVVRGVGGAADNNRPGYGSGTGTTIAPLPTFPAGQAVLQIGDPSARRPTAGVRLSGLRVATLPGDAVADGVDGLLVCGYRAELVDVFIDGMTGDGCVVRGTPGWNTYETKFRGCHFRRSRGRGLVLAENSADMHFTDCVVHGNGGIGLEVIGGASCHYVSVHLTGNRTNVRVAAGSRSKWIGCKLEAAAEHNVLIDATGGGPTDLSFVGCNFNVTRALAGDDMFDNFVVARTSGAMWASGVIAACTFQQIHGTNRARHHVNLSGAAAYEWRVDGCRFDHSPRRAAVNHDRAAVRCIVGGMGRNVGDPRHVGQWAGYGIDGDRVVDVQSGMIYSFMDGEWMAEAGA